jgi:NitT/TauT family transport system permease protein
MSASSPLARSWRASWPLVAVGVVALAGWGVVGVAYPKVPGPAAAAGELGRMIEDGRAISILFRTVLFMGVCFSIAAIAGIGLGLLLGTRRALDRGASPYLAALQAMPTGMWIPVAAIAFGASTRTLGAVVTIGAMPAIVLGTRAAVKNIPPILLRASRTFGEGGVSMLRRVVLPAALPGIVTGLELGWSIAFRCLVAGEIFAGTLGGTGIGQVIARSRQSGDLVEMLATIVIILALSIAVDRLVFSRLQHRLRHTRGLIDSGLPH